MGFIYALSLCDINTIFYPIFRQYQTLSYIVTRRSKTGLQYNERAKYVL